MDIHKKVLLSCATLMVGSVAFAGGDRDYDRELVMREDDDRPRHVKHKEDEEEGFFELLVMGGVATVDTNNADIYISENETDTLSGGQSWDSWTAQIGVGYVYPLDADMETGEVVWFPNINPQLNVYYLDGADLNGDVYLFGDPALNEASYDMDFKSTRLMFDLALTVASVEKLSLYALAGAGIAWSKTDLSSLAKPGFDIVDIHLGSNTSTNFAYEFGGGLTYAVLEDVAVSLEYLYTGFTDVSLGQSTTSLGTDEEFTVGGTDFNAHSQALLLGLRLAL